MRTMTRKFNVYSYEELSDKAKDRAYNDWISEGGYDDYLDVKDFYREIDEIEKNFDIKTKIYSSDNYTFSVNSEYRSPIENEWYLENLSGEKLYGYLMNKKFDILFEKKRYFHKTYSRSRESNVFFKKRGFDGYGIPFYEHIHEYIENPDMSLTYCDLMEKCLYYMFSYFRDDMEYFNSQDYFEEYADCTDMEFLKDGSLYVEDDGDVEVVYSDSEADVHSCCEADVHSGNKSVA